GLDGAEARVGMDRADDDGVRLPGKIHVVVKAPLAAHEAHVLEALDALPDPEGSHRHGGPEMAPNPPSFVAPRRSRGAPLVYMGAPRWAPTPHRSSRPGGAVALLWFTWGPRDGPQPPIVRRAPAEPWRSSGLHGGPEMAPNPPSFVAPRRSRGAPLVYMGAPRWPPTPHRPSRPGGAAARLYSG